jgi:hypothetical protein
MSQAWAHLEQVSDPFGGFSAKGDFVVPVFFVMFLFALIIA